MTIQSLFATAIAAPLLAGCAHPIKIVPDVTKIERVSGAASRVTANVGYYIPPEVSSVEVTTQGGGGDNVRYFPYRDMDAGYHKMLSNVFSSVVQLNSVADLSGLRQQGVNYIIVPVVVTTSGGSGLFTWPPTNFSVDLTSNIRDISGTLIASPRVVGTGSADTSERLHDYAIAGKRAMEDALLKMQAALLETMPSGTASIPLSATPRPAQVPGTVADRLAQLRELREKELISEAEYEAKRKEILDSL